MKDLNERRKELEEAIEKESQERLTAFAKAYHELCNDHGCSFVPQLITSANRDGQVVQTFALQPVIDK